MWPNRRKWHGFHLAAFVHANMPYGNAGALTVQEAWDVACFVDAQTRPGKQASRPEETVCPTPGP